MLLVSLGLLLGGAVTGFQIIRVIRVCTGC